MELQQSNLDRMHGLTNVLVASSVRYWRMELLYLISMYAALHVLMMRCFIERLLSKMKLRLRTVPENSTLVLLREIVCGCDKVVLIKDNAKKRIASVLSLFSLNLFSSIHSPISLTQSGSKRTKSE